MAVRADPSLRACLVKDSKWMNKQIILVNFVLAVQSDAQLLICFSPIWNISDIKIEANTQGGGKI